MKRFFYRRYILNGLLVLCCVALPAAVWLVGGGQAVVLAAGVGALLMLLLAFLQNRNSDRYMEDLVASLSDLIATLTELRDQEVFPVAEDTLLSKLQTQVIKLTGILKARSRAMEEERNEIKSLISDISHQLKTPIATMKMYGDLLMEDGVSETDRREYLSVLNTALNKLVFLTDSMIKMSRLESGVIQLKPQTCSLNETLLQAVKQVYHKAEKKNIEITLKEEASVTLRHDRNWTAEALFNILDNGVKYTPSGGKMNITVLRYELFARVDVADSGMGIPEEEQAHIFRRFYRGQNTQGEEGVGIGLYLCRKILSDQGGYIKVKSTGAGSVFSVYLPL